MARKRKLKSVSHPRPRFILPMALSSLDSLLDLAIPLMTP